MRGKRKLWSLGLCLLFCLLALGGCKKKEKTEKIEEDFVYPTEELSTFCVSPKGTVYALEKGKAVGRENNVKGYDHDGTCVAELSLGEGMYTVLCASEEYLYAFDRMYSRLNRVRIADGQTECLYERDMPVYMVNMVLLGKRLYMLVREPLESMAEAELLSDEDAGYSYRGEKLYFLDLENNAVECMEVEGITHIFKKSETELGVYAFAQGEGFYFRVYDIKKDAYTEEYPETKRTDLSYATSMAYDTERNRLLYPDDVEESLKAMDISDTEVRTSYYPIPGSLSAQCGLHYADGSTYYLAKEGLLRVSNQKYIKENKPIRVLGHSVYMPSNTLGYQMAIRWTGEETMAMKLMAGDSDFDLLVLSTAWPLAGEVKRVGAFAPLDDVEGLKEYVDTGFLYVREAARSSDGKLWMFPLDVSMDVLLYNPQVCKEYGFDLQKDCSAKALTRLRERLREEAEEKGNYYYLSPDTKKIMESYLAGCEGKGSEETYGSEEFLRLAKFVKEDRELWDKVVKNSKSYRKALTAVQMNGGISTCTTWEDMYRLGEESLGKVAVSQADKNELSRQVGIDKFLVDYFDYTILEALPMPCAAGDGTSPAELVFYVVNPNSDNKEATFEYLAALARERGKEESIYWNGELSGEYGKLEQEIHKVFASGSIWYSYPDDVFWEEFNRYLNDVKELEDVVLELKRRRDFYLKE